MTTLTPFRLFQLAKYAWVRYAPEIIPFHSKPNTYNRLKATLQDTSRDGTRNVGFHVEERRSWDTRSTPVSTESTHLTKSADVEIAPGSDSRTVPPQHKASEKEMETVSSPPDPKSPMGGPDKKGGITASNTSEIKRLMVDATLWTPDFKAPRNVIVLCHGMSFKPLGPACNTHNCFQVSTAFQPPHRYLSFRLSNYIIGMLSWTSFGTPWVAKSWSSE